MSDKTISLGKLGEDLAADYLSGNGYSIIERNYRFGHGEIDIIAEYKEILVFVEVKTRNNLNFGRPEYAITKNKQKQIRKISQAYLYEKEISDKDCRLDVISILIIQDKPPQINHIENAF